MQQLRTYQQLLQGFRRTAARRTLTAAQRQVLRVARTWIKKAMESQLDLLARLQVLEGAAGVPEGAWTKSSLRRGLRAAADHFSRAQLHPDWLKADNTGAYRLLRALTDKALRSFSQGGEVALQGMSTDDFLQVALSGLGAKTQADTKRMTYEAGKDLARGILSGKESPRSVFGGLINKWLRKRVDTFWRDVKFREEADKDMGGKETPMDDEDQQIGRGTRNLTEQAKDWRGVVFLALADNTDKLGKAIFDWAVKKFANISGGKYLLTWLKLLRREGGHYRGIWGDVADELGVKPQGVSKYAKPMTDAFLKAITQEPRLMKMVDLRVDLSEAKSRRASGQPKSKWDKLNKVFRWSSPADKGAKPWRVSDKGDALSWLKSISKEKDIYTDYESSRYQGKEQIWVGLRDNRDKDAHKKRLEGLFKACQAKGGICRWGDKGHSHFFLVDDHQRDALRKKAYGGKWVQFGSLPVGSRFTMYGAEDPEWWTKDSGSQATADGGFSERVSPSQQVWATGR